MSFLGVDVDDGDDDDDDDDDNGSSGGSVESWDCFVVHYLVKTDNCPFSVILSFDVSSINFLSLNVKFMMSVKVFIFKVSWHVKL